MSSMLGSILRLPPALAILPALLLPGCFVETTRTRIGAEFRPRPVEVLKDYRVLAGGREVGRMRLLKIHTGKEGETWYQVLRKDGQEVGRIDLLGRAFRQEPFREGWVLVSMDRVEENLRILFELRDPPVLAPAGKGPPGNGGRAVEASAERSGGGADGGASKRIP